MELDAAAFAVDYPPAAWWAALDTPEFPDDTGPLDPDTGQEVDCVGVSARFADWAARRGRTTTVVEGTHADYPWDSMVDFHRWVVVGDTAYDWTVRQYGNLQGPGAQAALEAPVPMTWPAHQPHPILGFRTVEVLAS